MSANTPERYICNTCGDLHKRGTGCGAPSSWAPVASSAPSSLLADWDTYYQPALQEADDKATVYKQAGDMYGWNFWQGIAGGLRQADIALRRVKPNDQAER